jgi:anthranilate synthase component 1
MRKPIEVFLKVYGHYDYAYLLESVEGPRKLARYSFVGFNPRSILRVKNGEMLALSLDGETVRDRVADPLTTIRRILERSSVAYRGLRFVGGAVGYVAYDAIRYWEKLPEFATGDLECPDIEVGIFDDCIVFDHRERRAFYCFLGEDRIAEVKKLMRNSVDGEALSYTQPKVNTTKESFENAVVKAKEYISSGDILQVVLSKRYDFNIKGDLINFYNALRRINPSPYMYFLKMGDRKIIGSSPEMLVRVDNEVVETFPIAGTRPCVGVPSEKRALAKELLADPKERAEHVMLVDLARNDIGKVAEFGSVHVSEFMRVRQYSHVQHIVSRVVGRLRADCNCYDALKAMFPAGTVSGAPKVRAMEIIEELEPTRRGPYAGAVGYFSYNGNADFAITIRTLIVDGNKASIQVGAGIVADSVPEREWFETEHKTGALMKALRISGESSL